MNVSRIPVFLLVVTMIFHISGWNLLVRAEEAPEDGPENAVEAVL